VASVPFDQKGDIVQVEKKKEGTDQIEMKEDKPILKMEDKLIQKKEDTVQIDQKVDIDQIEEDTVLIAS